MRKRARSNSFKRSQLPDSEIRLKLLELRLKRAFTLSKASAERKQTLIAKYRRGLGEGSSSIHYGVSSEECFDLVQLKLTRFRDDWNVAAVKEFCDKLPPSLNVARCAIEMAMLDHLARELELPLHTYLRLPAPKPVASAFTITQASNSDIARQLESAQAFRNLKLKVGFEGDLKFIDDVLKFGERRLYLDANGGWTRDEAIERTACGGVLQVLPDLPVRSLSGACRRRTARLRWSPSAPPSRLRVRSWS